MRRDVIPVDLYAENQTKGGIWEVSFASGFYQYTEALGYGDGQLPRVCRCVKKKKDEKGYSFLAVQHVAQLQVSLKR